jgi:hypothetical protein
MAQKNGMNSNEGIGGACQLSGQLNQPRVIAATSKG